MDDEKLELSRVGSLCNPDPHTQLLEAWISRDLSTFKSLLEQPEVSPDHYYDDPHLGTILFFSCKEDNGAAFTAALLNKGAQVNNINKVRKKAPVHVAAEFARDEALEVLLSNPGVDVNILDNFGNTPLHLIAKQKLKGASEDTINKYRRCIQLLMNQDGIRPNIPNRKGNTAVHLAADIGAREVVQTILEHSGDDLDVDSTHVISGKTAREIITEKYPELAELLPEQINVDKKMDSCTLFQHLYHRNHDAFIAEVAAFPSLEVLEQNDGSRTLLQYSAENGLEEAVRTLLEKGVSPNATCPAEARPPALLACYGGHPHILHLFINCGTAIDLRAATGGGTALHAVLNSPRADTSTVHRDYKACLALLLNNLPNLKLDINATDLKGNTALHYAAKNEDDEAVLILLKHGAYIGVKNVFGDPPLANISPKMLEDFLNDCLGTNGEFPREDSFEVTFSYKFLEPPVSSLDKPERRNSLTLPLHNSNRTEDQQHFDQKLSAATTNTETEPLLYISKSRDLKHLLKHPVFTSFLDLKWHRVQLFFYINLLFYVLFVAVLTLYILVIYGSPQTSDPTTPASNNSQESSSANQALSTEPKPNIIDNSPGFCWGLLLFLLILLILREIFQFLVSFKQYVRSPENGLELLLFISTAGILFCGWVRENAKPHFSAIAILFSWAELVLLVGRHPRLSVNIEMFKTVSVNFLKFLAWYAILIVAFALSFYTLFRDCGGATNCGEDGDSEENFFLSPGMSVFKTVVMLTGEFDAASIPFVSFPGTSHIVFVLFVFLIAIVLFNLLNGLAVSDTQAIRDDAEVVSYISRVKLMSYIESMFQSSSLPFTATLKQICCCWPTGSYSLTSITDRVRMFPNPIENGRIRVLPNQGFRILFSSHQKKRQELEEENDSCSMSACSRWALDPFIVKRAIEILNSRGKVSELEQMKEMMVKTQEQWEEFQKVMEERNRKLGGYEKRFDDMEKSWRETQLMLQKILDTLAKRSTSSSDEEK